MNPGVIAAFVLAGIVIALIFATQAQAQEFDAQTASTIEGDVTAALEKFAQAIANAEGFGIFGAIPTLAHNPGDLVLPGWAGQKLGSAGISVLADDAEGWNRLYHQLALIIAGKSKVYNLDMTISDMAEKWTTTNSADWAANVANYLGVPVTATLRETLAV